MSGDTTAQLEIVARLRDLVSAPTRGIAQTGVQEFGRYRAAADQAGGSVLRMANHAPKVHGLNTAIRGTSTGLLMLAGQAAGAESKVGTLVSHLAMGFASGSAVAVGISLVSGLLEVLGIKAEESRQKEAERAAAAAQAREKEKNQLDEIIDRTRILEMQNAGKSQEEIELFQAGRRRREHHEATKGTTDEETRIHAQSVDDTMAQEQEAIRTKHAKEREKTVDEINRKTQRGLDLDRAASEIDKLRVKQAADLADLRRRIAEEGLKGVDVDKFILDQQVQMNQAKAEEAKRRQAEKDELEQLNELERRRTEIALARTPVQELQARQRHEIADLEARGVDTAAAYARHQQELNEVMKTQAESALKKKQHEDDYVEALRFELQLLNAATDKEREQLQLTHDRAAALREAAKVSEAAVKAQQAVFDKQDANAKKAEGAAGGRRDAMGDRIEGPLDRKARRAAERQRHHDQKKSREGALFGWGYEGGINRDDFSGAINLNAKSTKKKKGQIYSSPGGAVPPLPPPPSVTEPDGPNAQGPGPGGAMSEVASAAGAGAGAAKAAADALGQVAAPIKQQADALKDLQKPAEDVRDAATDAATASAEAAEATRGANEETANALHDIAQSLRDVKKEQDDQRKALSDIRKMLDGT